MRQELASSHHENHHRHRRAGPQGAEAPSRAGGEVTWPPGFGHPGGSPQAEVGEIGGTGRASLDVPSHGSPHRPRRPGGDLLRYGAAGATGTEEAGAVSFAVDVNLLLYASDSSSERHDEAIRFLRDRARG